MFAWEALDKTREEYRKKMRENEQELARVIGRLLRNKSILQQADERAKVSGTWSRRSGMIGKVCSEGSLLISMTWVDIQDEPRRTKSIGTLAV